MKVVLRYNTQTNELHTSAGLSVGFANPGSITFADELKEPSNDIKELVSAGMTAEDLIKLKHGGVI